MPCHISFRDVDFHASTTGVRIVVTTDIPCHIYCRLSLKHPWIHKKPSYRRGMWLNDDVRFCFTVYEDNEQYEAGDTLIHTFWKPNWPYCTTKWCYFWGKVAGVECVSTSPIFKYHNDGVSPIPPPDKLLLFNSIEPQRIIGANGGSFRTWNLSHFVPENATGVIIQLVNSHASQRYGWGARKPGVTTRHTGQIMQDGQCWLLAGLNDAREVELYVQTSNRLHFWFMGYTGPDAVFLDSWIDILPSVPNDWQTKDLSAQCPGAKALIIQIGSATTVMQGYGLRMLGSTDDRVKASYHDSAVIGCDANQKIQIQTSSIDPLDCQAWVVGYLKGDIITYQNAPSIGVSLTGSWQARTLSTAGSKPRWAICQVDQPWSSVAYGAKKHPSYREITKLAVQQSWVIVHCDDSYQSDFYRANDANQFYKIAEIL